MSIERSLIPLIVEDHFFDNIFEDMNQNAIRIHHDMRNAMLRITPRDPIARDMSQELTKHLDSFRTPVISNDDGTEALELQIDVSNYKPEEITIKTVGNELSIHAKHEDKTDHSSVYQEFSRKFTLPKNVEPTAVTSKLSRDGVLTISGPVTEALEPPAKKPALENN